jgi:HEPN domain-containing protein
VNRADFQELAELHLQHARALLDAKLYSGAYYMCGYVVECALKACICKRTKEFDFYRSPDESRDAWSHDFRKLIRAAGLESELNAARAADPDLNVNWESVANNWSSDSRYEPHGQQEAQLLLDAIVDPDHGVFSCLRQLW